MLKQVSVVLAAGLLAGGISMASAATMSQSSSTPSNSLSLSSSQQKTAWRNLHSQAKEQQAPSSFFATVGAAVPASVTIRPVSTKTASAVPMLKDYDFAMVNHKILIVNPKDRKIAVVITG